MSKKRTIYAQWGGDDELYVEAKYCGINFLVLLCDGIPMRIEKGKRGKVYISAREAAAWHRKELSETQGRSGSQKALDALEIALEKHAAGKVEVAK